MASRARRQMCEFCRWSALGWCNFWGKELNGVPSLVHKLHNRLHAGREAFVQAIWVGREWPGCHSRLGG